MPRSTSPQVLALEALYATLNIEGLATGTISPASVDSSFAYRKVRQAIKALEAAGVEAR